MSDRDGSFLENKSSSTPPSLPRPLRDLTVRPRFPSQIATVGKCWKIGQLGSLSQSNATLLGVLRLFKPLLDRPYNMPLCIQIQIYRVNSVADHVVFVTGIGLAWTAESVFAAPVLSVMLSPD